MTLIVIAKHENLETEEIEARQRAMERSIIRITADECRFGRPAVKQKLALSDGKLMRSTSCSIRKCTRNQGCFLGVL